jgi:SAM-dependent methyltransferase
MSTIQEPAAVDVDKLMAFVFRAVDEVGATLNAALVVMGDRLGLYKAMAGAGPLTPAELAQSTGTAERYVREWLNAQAAGAFIDYDPDTGRYTLPAEQAIALTDESSPAYLPGFFQIALGSVLDSPKITEAARTGAGVGWHDHGHDVFEGCERFFRPGYNANLISAWLPALDGVVAKLERGATVADVGCGHGASTILMAQAFPRSTFTGSDYHEGSIETARRRAAEAGVSDRVRFETAAASSYSGQDYDLVTMFDCLHDMGDPAGAARHVRQSLAPDGTWMIVEPAAGDRVDAPVHPRLALAGGRAGTRGAGRRGPDPRRRHQRRPQPLPAGERDAVQPGVRGTHLISGGPRTPGQARELPSCPGRWPARGRRARGGRLRPAVAGRGGGRR